MSNKGKDMTRKEEITKAAERYWKDVHYVSDLSWTTIVAFKKGAEWADSTAWKPADGDNLPEIDREVIAIIIEYGYYKAVFAHRPNPNGDAVCYDEGGWNIPDVRYWLDLELPKLEE